MGVVAGSVGAVGAVEAYGLQGLSGLISLVTYLRYGAFVDSPRCELSASGSVGTSGGRLCPLSGFRGPGVWGPALGATSPRTL